jgi:hypothetical protein
MATENSPLHLAQPPCLVRTISLVRRAVAARAKQVCTAKVGESLDEFLLQARPARLS